MVATRETSIKWLTEGEGHKVFDERAQELMGMSGDEFLRRWDAGEYDQIADDPDHPDVMRLAALIPFGR
jgi:hypothetical protein